ncbi:MAG: O-methyltransferase [Bacteroidota bacterium]
MELIDASLQRYAEQHTTAHTALLAKIERDTHAQVLKPRMLSGHLQGRLLALISHMVKPKTILEIGTYTGYSALCLAEGLREGGKLITIDKNEELETRVRGYFREAGLQDRIVYTLGDARQVIPQLQESFDLVFIDADKENYSTYYDLVIDRVPTGGLILADNVLWSGKILDEKTDKDTRALQAFNDKVHADERVENVLLPVRDGILMIRKL